jgi:transposase
MVMLSRKKKNGIYYYYLEERARINGKSTRLWQKYVGTEEKMKEMKISLSPQKLEYKTMSFGGSAALLQVARKIEFVKTIDSLVDKKRDQNLSVGEYMLIATINRCLSPVSKSQLGSWFKDDYLSTVFPLESDILNSQTYWNHFQYLGKQKIAQIETELIKNALKVYNIDLSTLLFDPTNFFTFIENHETVNLAQFGHSKENRNNLRIVNVSLVNTLQAGIPVFHQTYEGNVQDSKHFKEVIKTITTRFETLGQKVNEIVIIFDKGNHSVEAFKEIDNSNLQFIASLRNSTQKDLLEIKNDQFTMISLPSNGKKVGYYHTERTIYDKVRNLYVLYDPQKQSRVIAKFELRLQKKLKSIETLLTKLNEKKWRSEDNVERKLKLIIGKKPFNEMLLFTITGQFAKLEVTIQQNNVKKQNYFDSLGRSIIFTNLQSWDTIKIIQAFRDKYIIEDAFKNLKNSSMIAIRPMFHWSDACIRAHVFSCVLSLLLLSLLRKELDQKQIELSYSQILNELNELQLTMIFVGSTSEPFYKLNLHSTTADKIYKILNLKTFLPV